VVKILLASVGLVLVVALALVSRALPARAASVANEVPSDENGADARPAQGRCDEPRLVCRTPLSDPSAITLHSPVHAATPPTSTEKRREVGWLWRTFRRRFAPGSTRWRKRTRLKLSILSGG